MSNVFYVYEHWRPDLDVPFYVGKGKGKRAYKMRDRGSHHARVMAKLSRLGMCVEVRLVQSALSEEEAFSVEKSTIKMWRELGVDLINKTDGGDGVSGFVMSEEARQKMSLAKKGKPGLVTMLGKKHSMETRAKMSAAHKGKPKSPEHAAKVGLRHRGKKVVVSAETKAKMSLARKGKKLSEKARENIKKGWELRRQRALLGEYN